MHAARNVALCTKDCLCLFVCPTGATDTENGQIDFSRCLDGCRLCVDACPSHAIYLVMDSYPEPKKKDARVSDAMSDLMRSKAAQEAISSALEAMSNSPDTKRLARALVQSNRILAEDCSREAGYMLPQSNAVRTFLSGLLETKDDNLPSDAVKRLLELL